MLRFLVYLIQRFYFRSLGYQSKVELLPMMHDDEEFEAFLAENDWFPVTVHVCPNPCGCVSLEVNGQIVRGWVTADQAVVTL